VKKWLAQVALVLVLSAALASAGAAQRRYRRVSTANPGPRFGAHVGYNFDIDKALLGAQLSWPIVPALDLYPSFDYYFVSGSTVWALNFDVKYRPPTTYRAWYVGGGLNYTHGSSGGTSSSSTNLNLLTGLEGRRGRTRPYVEAKLILGDGSAFQLAGGISWR
jgi:hypothetical protein